jgi:hypothetical protein
MPYFRYRALVALTLLLLPWTAKADYLSELQQQSREAGLSDRREWHDLLHYRPDLLGGYTSLADTPVFFHAPDGKSNPQAELDATLAAFFDSAPDPATNQPKQCRLIARYQWLKSRLRFDPARLPEQSCARFDAWYAAMAPRQVTLIYPAAYLNGPSSMFGHTLLRIDNGDHNTQLFAYALNFAAATDEANGLIFAVRGLFGGYPGYFSTAPYYEKVKEYNNLSVDFQFVTVDAGEAVYRQHTRVRDVVAHAKKRPWAEAAVSSALRRARRGEAAIARATASSTVRRTTGGSATATGGAGPSWARAKAGSSRRAWAARLMGSPRRKLPPLVPSRGRGCGR